MPFQGKGAGQNGFRGSKGAVELLGHGSGLIFFLYRTCMSMSGFHFVASVL